MSGVGLEKLGQAFKTFENVTGPGQYEKPNLNGDTLSNSKQRNVPRFSLGLPRRPNVVNPETRNTILSPHRTPAGVDYEVIPDNIYYNQNRVTHRYDEKRFFSPKNMPAIKAKCAHQYTAQDGISPAADMLNAASRGSLLSGYFGGSQTASYRQVDIGKGKRFDFTTDNVKDKGEPKYSFEKFGSIQYQVHMNKERGTRKQDTFNNTYDKYEKAVVSTGLNHYLGKGVDNHNGLGA